MSFAASAALVGTLIVVAPTSEGMVIAADSLAVSTSSHRRCSFDTKIGEIVAVDRTVFALTGLSSQTRHPFVSTCGTNMPLLGELDIRNAFREYVESQKKTAETISLAPFAGRLQGVLNTLPADFRRNFARQFNAKPFAQIVVASYNEKTSTSIIRSAWIGLKPGTGLVIAREKVERINQAANFMLSTFGERPYTELSIADGTLKKFFADSETQRLIGARARVSTIEKQRAAKAAADVIDAVGTRMKTIPSKNAYNIAVTVGGPVDVLFVGKEPRPERLQWKPVSRPRIAMLSVKESPTPLAIDNAARLGLATANFAAPRVVETSAPLARDIAKGNGKTRFVKNMRVIAVRAIDEAPPRTLTANFAFWRARTFSVLMPPHRREGARTVAIRSRDAAKSAESNAAEAPMPAEAPIPVAAVEASAAPAGDMRPAPAE